MTWRDKTVTFGEPGFGWFRLLGRGIAWQDTRQHPAPFSVRAGYRRHLRVGAWLVTWLRR